MEHLKKERVTYAEMAERLNALLEARPEMRDRPAEMAFDEGGAGLNYVSFDARGGFAEDLCMD